MEKDKGGVRCGYVYEHLDLRDRQWTCPQCGTTLDRDVNAATNILRQGIASSESPRKTKVRLRKWLVKNGIAEDTPDYGEGFPAGKARSSQD